MSTNKTENLGLHSWVREDPFRMDEFNENFDKLDRAVGANAAAVPTIPKFTCGTYAGDGKKSQFIELGFTPKVVYVGNSGGHTMLSNGVIYGGVAVTGSPAVHSGDIAVEIVENGFAVYYIWNSVNVNISGTTYRYFAIG